MKCPRCLTPTLKPISYEGVEVEECQTCKGHWLDDGELVKILDIQVEKFSAPLVRELLNETFAGIPDHEKRSRELCPKCNKPMQALNYQYGSGIVLDRCFEGHGVWMDKGELDKAQAYHEHWSKEAAQNKDAWTALAQSALDSDRDAKDEQRKKDMRPTKYLVNSVIRKLLGL